MFKKIIILSSLLVFAFENSAFADAKQDFYIQQRAIQRYFNLPQNARTFGMAGSSVATSHDSSSVIGNPAGIGFMQDAEVSATYMKEYNSGREEPSYDKIQQDINSGQALMAIPLMPYLDALPEFGNLGLGWSGYNSDTDDSPDTETKGYRIHATYAKAIGDTTSVGYGFTYYNDQLDNDNQNYSMDDGYRHIIGVQEKMSEAFTLGASFFYGYGDPNNTLKTVGGPDINQSFDRKSFGGEIGGSYDLGATLLATSFDYEEYNLDNDAPNSTDENGRSFAIRLGVEQDFLDWLKGRVGYRYQANIYYFGDNEPEDLSGTAKYNAISFGAGVDLKDYLRLDYGAEYRWIAYNDWVHVVSLSVPFSICDEKLFTTTSPSQGDI